jgi:hypothetical protein
VRFRGAAGRERQQLRWLAFAVTLMLAGWLAAGVAVLAVAIVAGDAVDAAVGGGLPGFVAILLLLGLVGGAVGGAVEGAALRRSLDAHGPASRRGEVS